MSTTLCTMATLRHTVRHTYGLECSGVTRLYGINGQDQVCVALLTPVAVSCHTYTCVARQPAPTRIAQRDGLGGAWGVQRCSPVPPLPVTRRGGPVVKLIPTQLYRVPGVACACGQSALRTPVCLLGSFQMNESFEHERLKSSLAFRKPATAAASRRPARADGPKGKAKRQAQGRPRPRRAWCKPGSWLYPCERGKMHTYVCGSGSDVAAVRSGARWIARPKTPLVSKKAPRKR